MALSTALKLIPKYNIQALNDLEALWPYLSPCHPLPPSGHPQPFCPLAFMQ